MVYAEQQQVAGSKPFANLAQNLYGVGGLEVADAGTDVENHTAARGWNIRDAVGVVGHARLDADAGNFRLKMLGSGGQRGFRNIDGDIIHRALAVDGGLEEQAGFFRSSGAEFDYGKGTRTGLLKNLVRVARKNGALGAGEVILGQASNGLEEARTAFVIKQPRRKPLWTCGEAAKNLGADGSGSGLRRSNDG